jgi:hypothetical protein
MNGSAEGSSGASLIACDYNADVVRSAMTVAAAFPAPVLVTVAAIFDTWWLAIPGVAIAFLVTYLARIKVASWLDEGRRAPWCFPDVPEEPDRYTAPAEPEPQFRRRWWRPY